VSEGASARSTPAGAADELALPAVTVAIPVLDEERNIGACLDAIQVQTYPRILEVLVSDGGSIDRTREIAAGHPLVRIVDNPLRTRPAGLNAAIREAVGQIVVRVDARTVIAPDYVERCVEALRTSGAAVVGGPMRFTAESPLERGIAAAMRSRFGAGPAQFRRSSADARLVDTVYLGAYQLDWIRSVGGYDEDFGGNEDAELNYRARASGGVWLDPAIRSTYAVREGLPALWCQYRRYGRARAGTMLKHPRSIAPRQLAIPALVAGLVSPLRRPTALLYVSAVIGRGVVEAFRDPRAAPALVVALPTMHSAWATGFAERMLRHIRLPMRTWVAMRTPAR
jgi:succinoglycan biosynthesis protein ExoA